MQRGREENIIPEGTQAQQTVTPPHFMMLGVGLSLEWGEWKEKEAGSLLHPLSS